MLISSLILCLLAVQDAGPQSPASQKPGSLAGQVVSLAGEPIRKAQVLLRRVDGRDAQPFAAVSDSGGAFVFPELQPGRYIVSAEKPGYVHQEFGASQASRVGTTISIGPGQEVTGIVMKLAPQAVIAGKVLDEDGDPVPNGQVMVFKQRYMRGKRQWMPSGGVQVNDLGEFRASGLQPGRYLVAASSPRTGITARSARSAKAPFEEMLVTTYYPGVIDVAQATPVEVAAGAEERSIDLRMIKARTYRVSGKIVDPVRTATAERSGGGGNSGVMLMLSASGSDAMSYVGRNVSPTRSGDGGFEFDGILPGAYTLTADRRLGAAEAHYGAHVDITVGDQNVDGVIVQLVPGADLGGGIRVDGNRKVSVDNLRINLQTLTPISYANFTGQVKPDGRFVIEGVLPDKYRVNIFPQSDLYLRTLRFGNQEVKDGLLDLSGGVSGSLELVMASDGAALTGKVQDSKQRPAAGVTVVLAPDGARRSNPDLFKNAVTDQNGSFAFRAIPPGEYKVFAWEAVEEYAWTDPAFLGNFESQGKSLSLNASANENLTISFVAPEGGSQIEREADEREKNNNK